MEKIVIKEVYIKDFRNLKLEKYCELDSFNPVFSGDNAIGKTNVLNAICWCLTGYDLLGNSKSLEFINTEYVSKNRSGVAVDVEVKLNVGTIHRYVNYDAINNKCVKHLEINGQEIQVSKGEVQIDKMLGLLDLTIGVDKDFNVRRFFLDPLYSTTCKESALRSFIIKIMGIDERVENYARFVPPFVVRELEGLTNYQEFADSVAIDLKTKNLELGYWLTVQDYYTKYKNGEVPEDVNNAVNVANKDVALLKQKQVALSVLMQQLNLAYDKRAKEIFGTDTGLKMYEIAQNGEIKGCCHPSVKGTLLSAEFGSTSERMRTAIGFVDSVAKYLGRDNLFMLFDECETFTFDNITKLFDENKTHQFLTAKVSPNHPTIYIERY